MRTNCMGTNSMGTNSMGQTKDHSTLVLPSTLKQDDLTLFYLYRLLPAMSVLCGLQDDNLPVVT